MHNQIIYPAAIPHWLPENDHIEIAQKAALMLDIPVEKIFILRRYNLPPVYYPHFSRIERLLRKEGFVAPYTFIHHQSSRQSYAGSGLGFELYRSHAQRADNSFINFVYCCYPTSNSHTFNIDVIILNKDDVFRFVRYTRNFRPGVKIPTLVLEPKMWQEIQDNTVGFLKLAKRYKEYNIRPAKGLLIHGAPGNGKTQICRWLIAYCEQNGISFSNILSAHIHDAHGKGTLGDLVNSASVMFFDDIDINFFTRKQSGGLGCDFLSALDGTSNTLNCCVRIFTSNEKLVEMDPAFKRPGRIDRSFELLPPNYALRFELVKTWPKEITSITSAEGIAAGTEAFSFAELELVRSTMVLNHLLHNDQWNFPRAVEEVKHRLNGMTLSKPLGFSELTNATEPEGIDD